MFARLAKMLGVPVPQLEDALRSEKRAQAQLSRRGLLLAGAASATTAILPARAWAFPRPAYGIVVREGETLVYRTLPELRVRMHQPFYDALVATSGSTAIVLARLLDEPLFPGM
jgi:hypothetical protein